MWLRYTKIREVRFYGLTFPAKWIIELTSKEEIDELFFEQINKNYTTKRFPMYN